MLTRIPAKNNILENEITYLQNQHEKGLKLRKRGLYFYHFEQVTPEKVTYEIDLLPQKIPIEYFQTLEGSLVTTQKMFYKKSMRAYYVVETDSSILVNHEMRLKYYKWQAAIWDSIFTISMFFFMSALSFHYIHIANPVLRGILAFSAAFIFPLFISVPKSFRYHQAVENVNLRLGQSTKKLAIHYTIRFNNLTELKKEGLSDKLSLLGNVKQVDERFFRLNSTLGKEKLLQEIISVTEIQEENIHLMHPMDMWFIIPW